MDVNGLAAELDAAHDRAREAYARRDAAGYLGTFHPELRYAQHDGKAIDRARLAQQVRTQLSRVHRATTDYRRESLEFMPDGGALEMELTRFRGRLTRPSFGAEVVHEIQQEGIGGPA